MSDADRRENAVPVDHSAGDALCVRLDLLISVCPQCRCDAQEPDPANVADSLRLRQRQTEAARKMRTDNATQNAPDQPSWDPLRAEKDLEVGQYYMRKGDVDAAIDRFQDATTAKPGYAIPFRYLGEAQEKKACGSKPLRRIRAISTFILTLRTETKSERKSTSCAVKWKRKDRK